MTAVVVLPICHRSGSSLLSSILMDLGVNMGDEQLGPGPGNPWGHFEDRDFYKANETILAEFGASWTRPRVISAAPMLYNHLSVLVRYKAQQPLWGWKDPRTTLTWPIWRAILVQNEIPYKVVGITRDRKEITNSLIRRSGGDVSQWNKVFWTYGAAWFDWMIQENGHVVKYEALLETPNMEIQQLAKYLGVPFNKEAAKRVKR